MEAVVAMWSEYGDEAVILKTRTIARLDGAPGEVVEAYAVGLAGGSPVFDDKHAAVARVGGIVEMAWQVPLEEATTVSGDSLGLYEEAPLSARRVDTE